MRKRNFLYEIGDDLGVRYSRNDADVLVVDIYNVQKNKEGGRKAAMLGRLFGFFYQFDENELEPILDNHWAISIEIYDKKYCSQEVLDIIIEDCLQNTYVRKPYFAAIKLVKEKSDFTNENGRVASKDFLFG